MSEYQTDPIALEQALDRADKDLSRAEERIECLENTLISIRESFVPILRRSANGQALSPSIIEATILFSSELIDKVLHGVNKKPTPPAAEPEPIPRP